jgi:hypothetical protein
MAAKKASFGSASDLLLLAAGAVVLYYLWDNDLIQTAVSNADYAINPQDFSSSSGVSGLARATQVLQGPQLGLAGAKPRRRMF